MLATDSSIVMCIMETFRITYAYYGSLYSIYHNKTSHTLLTRKSNANHNKDAGKHAGYNNCIYDVVDSSEAITIRSVIFRKPKNRTKIATL